MLDEILKSMIASGPMGVVLAFFMYVNYKMVLKLFTVIETNTKAWTDAHGKLEDVSDAQKRRREDFE